MSAARTQHEASSVPPIDTLELEIVPTDELPPEPATTLGPARAELERLGFRTLAAVRTHGELPTDDVETAWTRLVERMKTGRAWTLWMVSADERTLAALEELDGVRCAFSSLTTSGLRVATVDRPEDLRDVPDLSHPVVDAALGPAPLVRTDVPTHKLWATHQARLDEAAARDAVVPIRSEEEALLLTRQSRRAKEARLSLRALEEAFAPKGQLYTVQALWLLSLIPVVPVAVVAVARGIPDSPRELVSLGLALAGGLAAAYVGAMVVHFRRYRALYRQPEPVDALRRLEAPPASAPGRHRMWRPRQRRDLLARFWEARGASIKRGTRRR